MELRIKEVCKEKGIFQKDLADKLGITDIALRASLKGNPTIGTLEKVANALGVDITELFKQKSGTIGIIRHNGESYEINTISDIEKLLAEIKGEE